MISFRALSLIVKHIFRRNSQIISNYIVEEAFEWMCVMCREFYAYIRTGDGPLCDMLML